MIPSQMFRLGWQDFVKGAATAVAAVIVTYLASALNAPGFQLSQLDWPYILKIAEIAFVSYISKNFFSDSEGKVFGKIG